MQLGVISDSVASNLLELRSYVTSLLHESVMGGATEQDRPPKMWVGRASVHVTPKNNPHIWINYRSAAFTDLAPSPQNYTCSPWVVTIL